MERMDIIEKHKEILLETGTHPAVFLIDRRGIPLAKMSTLAWFDKEPPTVSQCFMMGRQSAQRHLWNVEDVVECAFVTIEQREKKKCFVLAFCTLYPTPVFTERLIEIRHAPDGHVMLIDDGAFHPRMNETLSIFLVGLMSSDLSASTTAMLLLAAKNDLLSGEWKISRL